MTLKQFGIAAVSLVGKIVGFGTQFAKLTATDKDDRILSGLSAGVVTLNDMIDVVEGLQIVRASIGIGGEQAAQAAGAQLAIKIQKAFTDAGFKMADDQQAKFAAACVAQAGALADIRECFKK